MAVHIRKIGSLGHFFSVLFTDMDMQIICTTGRAQAIFSLFDFYPDTDKLCGTRLKIKWPYIQFQKPFQHDYVGFVQLTGPIFINQLKSNKYVSLIAIGSFRCYLFSHWLFKKKINSSFFVNMGPGSFHNLQLTSGNRWSRTWSRRSLSPCGHMHT